MSPRGFLALNFSLLLILENCLSDVAARADTFTATVKDDSTTSPANEAKGSGSSTPAGDDGASSTQKAAETPHFWQRDSRGGFANEGRDYCCPVAVSNSFVYLARHGFPALLPEGNGVQRQINLINELASASYFGTDPENGTSPGAVLGGVRKYIEDKGYSCERLEYEGWRKVGKSQEETVMALRPDLDWLRKGIRNPNGSVWLNIGWYVKGNAPDEWKRTGGHWVTLVGEGVPGAGDEADSHLLLIHNPLTRGNDGGADDPVQDVIQLTAMTAGILQVGKGSTQDAAGMYRISGPGLPISKQVDAAFLDAAVVLVIGS